jgi:hypothetical protein
MTLADMQNAVAEARATMRRADEAVRAMAEMCAGKLRSGHVDLTTLTALKVELRDFNIHTGCWRERR